MEDKKEHSYKPKLNCYEDLVALYVNLKEKNYPEDVVDDFCMLARKLGGNYKISCNKGS